MIREKFLKPGPWASFTGSTYIRLTVIAVQCQSAVVLLGITIPWNSF